MGVSVHLFLNEFLDHKDSGTAILSHFYLLAGCASPLWLEGWVEDVTHADDSPSEVLTYFGVLSLGIGDALVGRVNPIVLTIGIDRRSASRTGPVVLKRQDRRRQRGVFLIRRCVVRAAMGLWCCEEIQRKFRRMIVI